MEDNQQGDNQVLNEMVMIKNSEEFLKTLNKLVPKSEFVKSDAQLSTERRKSQLAQTQSKEPKQDQNDSYNSNQESSYQDETLTKQTSVKTTAKAILTSALANPVFPRQARIQKIMRNLDIDYSCDFCSIEKSIYYLKKIYYPSVL